MRTAEEARREATARLAASEVSAFMPTILDASTEEFEAGWIFYYQSRAFVESGKIGNALVGNAPLFVPRGSAPAQFISYHRPTRESVEAFLCCGDANGRPKAEVELTGWREGAQKVSATQAIRSCSSFGLSAAHESVERCLSGEVAVVPTEGVAAARELVAKLENLGFIARVAHEA